jgi:hypothetical protein
MENLYQGQLTAQERNRYPSELVSEALHRYLDQETWIKFVDQNETRARANGLTEADVDRLIAEVRSENRQNGC